MPTILTNMRATAGTSSYAISTQSIVIEMDDKIYQLEPNRSQLALLSSKVGKMAVENPKYEWSTDEHIPTLDRVNEAGGKAATTTATTFTVDNGGYYRVNGLVQIQRTGEVCRISAISGNVLTVTRAWGDSTIGTIVDNDSVTILGGAAAEGATSEDSKTTKKAFDYNYTEIKRAPFEFTNTELATKLYGPDDLSYQANKVGAEHAVDIENVLLFGTRGIDTSTIVRRTCGGIDEFISTNDVDFGGIFNMVTFFSFAEDVFRYGSGKKLMLAAPAVVSNISLEAIKYLEIMPKEKTFGIDIQRLLTPHGELMVTKHNLLEGDTYGKRAYVLDLDNIGYRFLKGRDTKLMTNIQANDKDARKDEYLTEFGFVRVQEKTHGRIKNAA